MRINRIAEYISQHFREHIALSDIAAMENITVCHASHVISDSFGVSFREYVNRMRLEYAVRLLKKSELGLTDICMESGFSSTRYLNNEIKKAFGCTAHEFRKERAAGHMADGLIQVIHMSDTERRYSFEQSAALWEQLRGAGQFISG